MHVPKASNTMLCICKWNAERRIKTLYRQASIIIYLNYYIPYFFFSANHGYWRVFPGSFLDETWFKQAYNKYVQKPANFSFLLYWQISVRREFCAMSLGIDPLTEGLSTLTCSLLSSHQAFTIELIIIVISEFYPAIEDFAYIYID